MKYKRHKKPSDKQLKVIALLQENPDMTPSDAARQAGYAQNTIHNVGAQIMKKPIVQGILANYRYQLEQHNIHPQRLAKKLDELLDASNPVITIAGPVIDKETGKVMQRPDRKIQIETIKLIHDVYGVKADTKSTEGLKKRITLEEFEEKQGIVEGEEVQEEQPSIE